MTFGIHDPDRLSSEGRRELQGIILRMRKDHSIEGIMEMFGVSRNSVYAWLDRRGGTNKRLERARELASQEIDDKREQLREVE